MGNYNVGIKKCEYCSIELNDTETDDDQLLCNRCYQTAMAEKFGQICVYCKRCGKSNRPDWESENYCVHCLFNYLKEKEN